MRTGLRAGLLAVATIAAVAGGKLILHGGSIAGGVVLGRAAGDAVSEWLSSPGPFIESFRSGISAGAGPDGESVIQQVAQLSRAEAESRSSRLVASHLTYEEQRELVRLREALAARMPNDLCRQVLWDGTQVVAADSLMQLLSAEQSRRLGHLTGLAFGRAGSGKPPLVPSDTLDDDLWASILIADSTSPAVGAILAAASTDPPAPDDVKCAGARGLLARVLELPQGSDESRFAVTYLLKSTAK